MTSEQRNSQDDSLVLEAIHSGCDQLMLIVARIQVLDDDPGLYRRVDRALQRLRKSKRIELAGKPRRWQRSRR